MNRGVVVRKVTRAGQADIDMLREAGSATVHEAQARLGLRRPICARSGRGRKLPVRPSPSWRHRPTTG